MPRFFSPPASAEQWQDRTPLTKVVGFTGAVTNDVAGTTRWTYTVPAGRRAFVGSIMNQCVLTAAGAGGELYTGIVTVTQNPTPTEANSLMFVIGSTFRTENYPGNSGGIWLRASDSIQLTTVTVGTTAVYTARTGMSALEFDA